MTNSSHSRISSIFGLLYIGLLISTMLLPMLLLSVPPQKECREKIAVMPLMRMNNCGVRCVIDKIGLRKDCKYVIFRQRDKITSRSRIWTNKEASIMSFLLDPDNHFFGHYPDPLLWLVRLNHYVRRNPPREAVPHESRHSLT